MKDINKKIEDIYEVTDSSILGFFKDYRYLSNFHQCQVWFEGMRFPSSENAFQAAKIKPEYRGELASCTPKRSKELWKEFPLLYTGSEWDSIRFNIMLRVVSEKFLSHPNLLERLKSTGDRYLEETNYWGDTYWGVCNGKGLNNLGKILMLIRDSQLLEKHKNILSNDIFVEF